MNKAGLVALVVIAGAIAGYVLLRSRAQPAPGAATAAPSAAAGETIAPAPERREPPSLPPAPAPSAAAPTPAPAPRVAPSLPPSDGGPVLSGEQLAKRDPVALRFIQRGLATGARQAIRGCYDGAVRRDVIRQGLRVDLQLTLQSRHSRAQVVDVDGDWPDDIDPTLRDCLVSAFAGVELPTDDFDFDYTVDYPLLLRPMPADLMH